MDFTSYRVGIAARMEAAAPATGSPNGVGGKKRPEEAILTPYGIGLAVKGYSGQPDSAAQKIIIYSNLGFTTLLYMEPKVYVMPALK